MRLLVVLILALSSVALAPLGHGARGSDAAAAALRWQPSSERAPLGDPGGRGAEFPDTELQGPELGSAEQGAGAGAALWRAADTDGAIARWRADLAASEDLPDAERARLAYNLGVAHAQAGDALRATGWFTAALEHAPRHADAAFNLDLARAEAGLAPKESGDLTGGISALVLSWTLGEARWIALCGVLLLGLIGLAEALRGGAWSRVALLAVLVLPVAFVPLAMHAIEPSGAPAMVVATGGADVFSVPVKTGQRLGSVPAGEIVRRVDGLPGWMKIRFEGEDRWVPSESVLSLRWPTVDDGAQHGVSH